MRDLLVDPFYRAEDLGQALPPTPYGVSVSLPLWEHVIGYEEQDPAILVKFKSGYPRFFISPLVQRLFDQVLSELGDAGEKTFIFSGLAQAQRAADYLWEQRAVRARVQAYGDTQLGVILFAEEYYAVVREYWRFCGEGISARQAQVLLREAIALSQEEGLEAELLIRQRLAGWHEQAAEDVYLFPSGMAANYAVSRMLSTLFPERRTVQLDFPYVDVLKLQQQFGFGAHFLSFVDEQDYQAFAQIAAKESLAGVFVEVPSNPMLRSVDLRRVVPLLQQHQIPLVIDDTVATCVNLDACRVADVVTSSLTKAFSGVGDVLAGSVVLNRRSLYYPLFSAFMKAHAQAGLFANDAVALELNSRSFAQRVARMSENSIAVYDYLNQHPLVAEVYHSKRDESGAYDYLQRDGAGHGCLVSFVLKNPAHAPIFYDALRFCKGPSLGTNFSLCCPYSLLAHYGELDWIESCGVDRYLLRFSAGLESTEEILARFAQAFAAISA